MKTTEEFLNEVAESLGYENWDNAYVKMNRKEHDIFIVEAMRLYAEDACKEQREICCNTAFKHLYTDKEEMPSLHETILNAPSPIKP